MTISFPDTEQPMQDARRGVLRRIRRIRRTRTIVATAAVLTVSALGTGGALVVQQVSQHVAATGVVCQAHDDLDSLSGTSVTSDSVDLKTGATTSPPTADKREMCALVWRGGMKQAAANGGHWPDIDPNTSTLPVPPLAFCKLDDGMTGGFPIEVPSTTAAQVCERLGLPVDHSV